jgi:peptidoglycan hydrolase-like protein with peptidoglycan-binding domain
VLSKLATALVAAVLPVAVMSPATAQSDKATIVSRLNMSTVPDLDRDGVRQVQRALTAKGFDPGPIDGVVGPITRGAVRKFQDRFGMKATGEIDNQTLLALGKVDLAADR